MQSRERKSHRIQHVHVKPWERVKLLSEWLWIMGAKLIAACVVCMNIKGKFLKGRLAKWEIVYWNTYYQNRPESKESILYCDLALNYSSERIWVIKMDIVELNLQERIQNVIDLYCWPHHQSKWRIECCETFKQVKTNRAVIISMVLIKIYQISWQMSGEVVS